MYSFPSLEQNIVKQLYSNEKVLIKKVKFNESEIKVIIQFLTRTPPSSQWSHMASRYSHIEQSRNRTFLSLQKVLDNADLDHCVPT